MMYGENTVTPLDEALRAIGDAGKKREALYAYRENLQERMSRVNGELQLLNRTIAKLEALAEVEGAQ